MNNEEKQRELETVIGEFVRSSGFELVELTLRRQGTAFVLRVLADTTAGGITIDELSGLNAGIGRMLEERGIIEEQYFLEVDSPGLDRPLRTESDFRRVIGKKVRVFLEEPVDGRIEVMGEVAVVSGDSIIVKTGDGETGIPLSAINKAKQVIEFGSCYVLRKRRS